MLHLLTNVGMTFTFLMSGAPPQVGFITKRGGLPTFDLAHVGHTCGANHAAYLNREFPEEAKVMIEDLVRARIPTLNIRHYLNQKIPDNNITHRDLDNFVQRLRGDSSSDAKNLLESLFQQQQQDPLMTVKTKQDSDGTLKVRVIHKR